MTVAHRYNAMQGKGIAPRLSERFFCWFPELFLASNAAKTFGDGLCGYDHVGVTAQVHDRLLGNKTTRGDGAFKKGGQSPHGA